MFPGLAQPPSFDEMFWPMLILLSCFARVTESAVSALAAYLKFGLKVFIIGVWEGDIYQKEAFPRRMPLGNYKHPGLYRPDGVHLSDAGLHIFPQDLSGGLCAMFFGFVAGKGHSD